MSESGQKMEKNLTSASSLEAVSTDASMNSKTSLSDDEHSTQTFTLPRLSAKSILNVIGNKLFNTSATEVKKPPEPHNEDQLNQLKKADIEEYPNKNAKKKKKGVEVKKVSRGDLLKFKVKYNNCIGNLIRSWMNIVYCTLLLRLNLVKLLNDNIPEIKANTKGQLQEENLKVYKIIKEAINASQEQSSKLWSNFEKLIRNYSVIKHGLEMISKEVLRKDWTGTALKLTQAEAELETIKKVHKQYLVNSINPELNKLKQLYAHKVAQIEQLLLEVSTLKKKEISMKGKILINLKHFRSQELILENLKNKNFQQEMVKLAEKQKELANYYEKTIKAMKQEISEKGKLINLEEKSINRKAKWILSGDIQKIQNYVTKLCAT